MNNRPSLSVEIRNLASSLLQCAENSCNTQSPPHARRDKKRRKTRDFDEINDVYGRLRRFSLQLFGKRAVRGGSPRLAGAVRRGHERARAYRRWPLEVAFDLERDVAGRDPVPHRSPGGTPVSGGQHLEAARASPSSARRALAPLISQACRARWTSSPRPPALADALEHFAREVTSRLLEPRSMLIAT